MKKIIFTVVAVLLGVSAWFNLRSMGGINISMLTGKTVELSTGDLTIPITASGTVEPAERVEIKSEAGGVVVKTPFEVGYMVREGDLLVELDPEDEQRLVDIAGKALEQAKINLRRAQNRLYQTENVDIPTTQARLEATTADLHYWEWKRNQERELRDEGKAHEDEYRQIESNYLKFKAERDRLDAELDRAHKNVELARLDVEQAELAVARSEDDLADARERLAETKIVAPTDGMLSRLLVKKGTVITSGSASFGGGTLLATLADVTQMYVKAQVDESDIGRVREIAPPRARPGYSGMDPPTVSAADEPIIEPGTPVKITVDAFPEDAFIGLIDLIEPEPDRGQVVITYVVRIRLTSENASKLMLGMQANVEFVSQSVHDVVLLPNEAVRIVAGTYGVYVPVPSQREPDKEYPRFVEFTPGLDNGAYTQVVDGLSAGQRVYTKLPRDPRSGRELTSEPTD